MSAEDASFTNLLAEGALSISNKNLPAALQIYAQAEKLEFSNAVNLCVLSRRYCDLMYMANSTADQKHLLERALACALQAVKADPKSATAHASLAVCYAKNCKFANIKTELAFSRLFKIESEEAIALDPQQDIAYYLLGRWNYGVANVGLLSRAFVKIVYGGVPKASNEDAIKNFKKAITLAPNRILYHVGLAMVYESTGETKLEIAELETCRALKPVDHDEADAQQKAEQKLAIVRK